MGQIEERADWQKFILKAYREGNRSGQRMSPAQVAVRVKVRAQELGSDDYPSHMTVYRLLQPVIDKQTQKQLVRSRLLERITLKHQDS